MQAGSRVTSRALPGPYLRAGAGSRSPRGGPGRGESSCEEAKGSFSSIPFLPTPASIKVLLKNRKALDPVIFPLRFKCPELQATVTAILQARLPPALASRRLGEENLLTSPPRRTAERPASGDDAPSPVPAPSGSSPGSGNPGQGALNPTPPPLPGARAGPGRCYPPSRLRSNPTSSVRLCSPRPAKIPAGTGAPLAAT